MRNEGFMFIKIIYTALIFGISSSHVSAGTVDDAQSMLKRLSYEAGAVDGVYGKKTRGAPRLSMLIMADHTMANLLLMKSLICRLQ